ncbi:PepSY domain-containing protein [Roseibium marinum]|uniref:PepSY domain-containing protein n=1 Tax=Roseibium marinum TaxID=281252 RepID=A0A2S3UXT2_9HYPH|nr:hypothetical protein [Roseibium marinum]POF32333.1 hypothetical protein CLV41_103256 [Roseibium marinum]
MKHIFVILVLLFAAVGPAQAACLSDAAARKVVASGQAASLGSVKGRVQGEILKAQLCEQGGGYVYVLSVKNGGKVTTVTVSAR